MEKTVLSTDSSCDVYKSELESQNVSWIPLTFTVDDVTYEDDFSDNDRYRHFYAQLREGKLPTTSQINAYLHEEYFTALLERGYNSIVHLTLSSGLSATYESACQAAENVMETHPGSKIYIVDSLGATQAQRIVLDEGIALRDAGLAAKDIAAGMEKCAAETHVYIVVDDLYHLKRGGRVSGAAAFVGTKLKLKPIIILNAKGALQVITKVQGTRKALRYVLEKLKAQAVDLDAQTVYLASADCLDTAKEFEEMLRAESSCEIVTGWIGPVIGAHTGGGTLGIVYRGKERLTR